jgi:hypothetical protein
MYELMLRFGPQKLFEEFAQQYIIEYGNTKFEKVASIVKSSDKIDSYINTVIINSSSPNADDLQCVMNSHTFFMWSKEETLCLGALGVILRWSGSIYDGYSKEQDELETRAMAKLIDKCSRLKYNQVNSFFDRFYRRLRLIEMQP